MADPDLSREVRDLAQRLGSHHDDGELALAIAEAQVDVGRVRMLRHALIARALKRFGALEPVVEVKAGRLLADAAVAIETNKFERAEDLIARAKVMIPPLPDDPSEREVAVLRDLAGQLTKLDRYERRALSRRTGAIRAFDTAQLTRATNVPSQSG
jgi:hypothetical protein